MIIIEPTLSTELTKRSIATWLKEVCAMSEHDQQIAVNEVVVRELQDVTGLMDLCGFACHHLAEDDFAGGSVDRSSVLEGVSTTMNICTKAIYDIMDALPTPSRP